MHPPRLTAAALAAGLILASAATAANHGVEALPGDRFSGEISPAGDRDAFVLPLGAGSRLSVDVRAAPGSPLLPSLKVLGPGGEEADLGRLVRGAGTSRVALRNLPLLETGGWAVVAGGEGASTGDYEISFAARSPSRFAARGVAVPAGQQGAIPFTAGDGAALSFVLRSRGAAPPAGVSLRDPSGAEFPIPAGSVAARGPRITGRAIPLAGPFGTWELRVAAAEGGNALVDAVLVVRSPKPRKLRSVLGPEPRPTSLAPRSGRDGTAFLVTGQGFDPGARVRFGETWAAGASVTAPTSVSGPAPDGPESTEGLQVAVTVANPDGQENAAPGSFRYLGVPKPESVTPGLQPPEGGRPLVIRGRNFRTGFSLSIGGVPLPGATLSPTGDILCTSPPHAVGTAAVVVTDEFGRAGTLATGVEYVGPPAPASVSPPSSSFTGGRLHVLEGEGFRAAVSVLVDGVPCEDVEVLDAAHIRFRMPPGPAGTFDVEVLDVFDRRGTGAGILRRRGPFSAAASLPGAAGLHDFFAHAAALGDLDGDGSTDILLASSYLRYEPYSYGYLPAARILLNDGYGAFRDGTESLLAGFDHARDLGQSSLALLGDLDGDGRSEAVLSAAYPIGPADYLFLRGGLVYSYALPSYYGTPYPDFPTYVATRVLAGGKGEPLAEATASRMPAPGSTPFSGFGERWQAAAAVLGDLDGDGRDDLVLAAPGFLVNGYVAYSTKTGGVTYLVQSYQYLAATRILRNDGSGAFTTRAGDVPAPTFMNGSYATRVAEEFDASGAALGDLDGDGDPDLVLSRAYPKLVYHLDTGTGTYTTYYLPATRILRNDGSGKFDHDTAAMPATEGSLLPGSPDYWQGSATALGDLDGDGDLDLVVGRPAVSYWYDPATTSYRLEPAIRVFANDGTGKFAEDTASFLPAASFLGGGTGTILDARCVALGDLDGDGSLDLVASGQTYLVYSYAGAPYGPMGILPAGERPATRVLLNDGTGKFADVTEKWLPAPANGDLFQADAAVLGDLDGDGDLDLVLASDSYPDSSATAAGEHNRPLRILECR